MPNKRKICNERNVLYKQKDLSNLSIYSRINCIDWFTCISQSHDIDHYLSLEYVNKFSIQSSLCNVAPVSTETECQCIWLVVICKYIRYMGSFTNVTKQKKKTIKLLFIVENAIIQRARERAAESSWSSCSTNVNQ